MTIKKRVENRGVLMNSFDLTTSKVVMTMTEFEFDRHEARMTELSFANSFSRNSRRVTSNRSVAGWGMLVQKRFYDLIHLV